VRLLEQLHDAKARCEKLAQETTQAQQALRSAQDESGRHARRVEKLQGDIDRLKADFEHKYTEDRRGIAEMEQKRTTVDGFAGRLTDAERELMAARDTLMAVEVKLAILEGAANVLDARMRAGTSGVTAGGAAV
jgi:chromosome segregation ATPase